MKYSELLGKYKGMFNISKSGITTLNETVKLIPLSDIQRSALIGLDGDSYSGHYKDSAGDSQSYSGSYLKDEYSNILQYIMHDGLDGTLAGFQKYWNNNIALSSLGDKKEIGIVAFWVHGNYNLIDLNDPSNVYIRTSDYTTTFTDIPPMIVFFLYHVM